MRRASVHHDAEHEDDQDRWRDDEEPHDVRPLGDLGQNLSELRAKKKIAQTLEAERQWKDVDERDNGEQDCER